MEGPWPPLLLALLLLPASLALTLHHRSDTADAYIITSDAEDPSSSVVAEPVQTPALTKGQPPLTPPARGSHAARQERTSANNASNEATSAVGDIRVLSLEHRSIDSDDNNTGAVEWSALGNLTVEQIPELTRNLSFRSNGTAEAEPGTLEQDQLDFELSSLQNEDGQGPAVVRNESLEQLRESEEAAAYAVPEDNVQPAAQNETVANSTLEPTPVSPVLTIPWGNGLSYEPSERSSATTSSSAEEDALSLKISGHSSQDQVRNVDALTGEVTSTSLDNGTLDESILKTTTFSNGIWVSNVSLGMTTTEAVAAQNLAVSQGNEWTPEVPSPNWEEATTPASTLPEYNRGQVTLPTDILETTTVVEFSSTLPGHNGGQVSLPAGVPEAATAEELSTILQNNASSIEAELTDLAKTFTSHQNSTEIAPQTTGNQLEIPAATETNEDYFERDPTLYQRPTTETADQTLSEVLQQEGLNTTQHSELPATSSTAESLGIGDPNSKAPSEIINSQASTPIASIIVYNASQREPEATTATLLGLPTMLSTISNTLGNLTRVAQSPGLNISDSFLGEGGDDLPVTNDASPPEVLDVSIEDLGNESHEQLANTTTEVLYETSQLEVPPVTTSERPDSREETTVRHTTEKREETTVLTIDDSSEAIQTSQTAEVETHNSTFASAEEHLGLEVRTISTDIAIEPALNHTEVEEQPSPAVTSPAESIMEESEVLFPSQPTTSYNSTTGTDEALTKVPATDSDIIESVSLQGETTAETDSPTATEGAVSKSHPETTMPVTSSPTLPSHRPETTSEGHDELASNEPQSTTDAPTTVPLDDTSSQRRSETTVPATISTTPPLRRPETTSENHDELASSERQSTTDVPTSAPLDETSSQASPATSTVGQSPPRPASCVPLEPPKRPSHEFRLVFSTSSEFSWEQVEALERRIQSFIRDTPCPRHFARTAFALGPPHTLSWTDPSANSTWCDRDSIDALLRTMRSDSGHPTPAITHAFYPEFRISSVELRLRGACVAGASAFPVVAVTVGVALSAALLAGLLTLLWKFLRMSPRSRRLDVTPAPPKDSFDLKQRRPILLPGESNKASANGTPHKSPHSKPNAPFVVDTDFCYINPNFLEVVKPSPPPPAPPYRQSLDRRVRSLEAVLPPPRPPHGPHSTLGNRSLGAEPTAEQDELNCTSSSSGVESDAQPSGEAKSADSS